MGHPRSPIVASAAACDFLNITAATQTCRCHSAN